MAPGDYKHILVAVDKFTKWIEDCTVTTVMSKQAAKFIEDITHRFGVPNRIVTDMEKAITGEDFWDFSSTSTTPQRTIHAATVRSSEETTWFFKASKTASSTTPRST
jgi:hypothetical protein